MGDTTESKNSKTSMLKCTTMVTFNCKSIKRSVEGVRMLCQNADIIALQETWLFPHDLTYLGTVDDEFGSTGISAMDTSTGLIAGRPHGGVALLWRRSTFSCVKVIECMNPRICAIQIALCDAPILV